VISYLILRLLYSIPVLIATSFIIFTFVSVSGDPLNQLRQQPRVSQQTIQNLIEENHLDKSVIVRYGYWVKDAVTDRFGTTLLGDRAIWPDLRRVIGNTLQLVLAAQLFAVLIALVIGVLSAIRQYSVFDYAATTFSFLGFAMPVFWLALMLQILFTNIYLKWDVRLFYTAQLASPDPGGGLDFLLDRVQHLTLPVVALAVLGIASYSRYTRASMLEVVNSDYVRTARAKGLSERRVLLKHAFRNALIPVTTVVAIDFGAIFGGAIVTESIFNLDGMGLYFINALDKQDPYPIMAWLMVVSTMIIAFNLLADVLYGYLDPRIRYD
jgi:peptide/nickel transport system permease protein